MNKLRERMSIPSKSPLLPEELFEKYRKEGDTKALEAIYDMYKNQLYSFAIRLTGSQEDGAEAFQEMWYKTHRNRQSWITGTSVVTWLFTILRNVCLDILRKRREDLLPEGGDIDVSVESRMGESALADWYHTWNSREKDPLFREHVEAGVQRLAPIHRALILYAFDGFSYRQMAGMEGISEQKVKSRIFHARQSLKAYLGLHGYEPDDVGGGELHD
jgi:RNA polymerase sigma-70 factor, ECF subfamily